LETETEKVAFVAGCPFVVIPVVIKDLKKVTAFGKKKDGE